MFTTIAILIGLVSFFMGLDIYIQKTSLKQWMLAVLPLIVIPALVFIQADIFINSFYVLNEIGLFLAFPLWAATSVGYIIAYSRKNQFYYHLWKGLAIAGTVSLVLIEAGLWNLIPLFGVGCWIINDLLWNWAFKQKWNYKGDGKGDVFDIAIKTPKAMIIIKVIALIIGILFVSLL